MMNNEELKEFRLMLGLTCQKAGDLMYLTKQQISNIETGKNKQKSTMYLMELCYKNYLEDHKSELINVTIYILDWKSLNWLFLFFFAKNTSCIMRRK